MNLFDRGYDRSLIHAVLPYVESRCNHPSLTIVYGRMKKRANEWIADEPREITSLALNFVESFESVQQSNILNA